MYVHFDKNSIKNYLAIKIKYKNKSENLEKINA